MIEYEKLFELLKRRNMKKTDLLEVISSPTLAKLGKNEIIKTDTIDKICLFLEVQPSDIMEVYEYQKINGKKTKIKTRIPDNETIFDNEIKFFTISELNNYIIEENGELKLDLKKIRRDIENLK